MGRLWVALLRADRQTIHPDLHTAAVLMAVLPVSLGFVILLGGPMRFSSGVWEMQRLVMPWWAWGTMFVIDGFLLGAEVLRGNIERARALLLLTAIVFFSLALGLLGSSIRNSDAAFTGMIVYSWAAVMQLAVRSSMPGPGER